MIKWIRGFVSGIILMMLAFETLLMSTLLNERKEFRNATKSFVER